MRKSPKTIKELCSLIAKREGLKKQVAIGNIREIVGIVSDLVWECENIGGLLMVNGYKRAKRNVRRR